MEIIFHLFCHWSLTAIACVVVINTVSDKKDKEINYWGLWPSIDESLHTVALNYGVSYRITAEFIVIVRTLFQKIPVIATISIKRGIHEYEWLFDVIGLICLFSNDQYRAEIFEMKLSNKQIPIDKRLHFRYYYDLYSILPMNHWEMPFYVGTPWDIQTWWGHFTWPNML